MYVAALRLSFRYSCRRTGEGECNLRLHGTERATATCSYAGCAYGRGPPPDNRREFSARRNKFTETEAWRRKASVARRYHGVPF